ncbi:MAG: GNAT family N-acetyltransferase [Pseudomonadota bacterium]
MSSLTSPPQQARRAPILRTATLRTATRSDTALCVSILADWLEHTSWMPDLHSRAETQAFMARQIAHSEVLVAGEGANAGFAVLAQNCLSALYIAAPGAGLGRFLLDAVKARRTGFFLWCFQANLGARRFYEREGLVETQRTDGDNEERLPDIRFDWTSA